MTTDARDDDHDYLAIRRLQSEYADTVTRGAWSELVDQFLPECSLTVGRGERAETAVGQEAIGELIDRATAHLALLVFTVLNTVVRIEGDTARTRSIISEVHITAETGARHDLFGVYHDRLERRDGRWWFAERHWFRLARTGRAMDGVAFPDEFDGWMTPGS